MDFLLSLGTILGSGTTNLPMLRWIVYIKSTNPEVHHISSKNNVIETCYLELGVKVNETCHWWMKMLFSISFRWLMQLLRIEMRKCSMPSMKVNVKGSGYI